MKKMMKTRWLMMSLLAIVMAPCLMSCSEDDDTKKEEVPVPVLKINGGDVSFTADQYEMTIASIEANNEVKLAEKPDWIEQVVVSKNADGTYSAVISRNKVNDTELRSGFITFSAATVTAKVAVSCGAQKLDATYTVVNSTAPTSGFFGGKDFKFSVLRATSTDRDTVLVYYYNNRRGYMLTKDVSITSEKITTSEAINSSNYTAQLPVVNDLYKDRRISYCFFLVNVNQAEDFDPNGHPELEPSFSVMQYNLAYSLVASASNLGLTVGKDSEVTVVYDNTVVSKLKVFIGEGWPDLYAENPIADMTALENVTLTQKSSSTDGKYTTVVYTISATGNVPDGGNIILLAMDNADKYVRDGDDACIIEEVQYMIVPAE